MIELFSVETMSILMLAVLIFVMMFGHPIAFVFGGVGLMFGYLLRGPAVIYMFTSQAMGTMDSGILVAIVMFIFMANLLVKSGIAEDLFEAIRWLMGPLRGGVAIAVIVVCMILAACTGIVGAAVVSMGLAALPVMMKYGYEKGLAAGTICAGGTLGIMFPPSIMLIVLADLTGLSAGFSRDSSLEDFTFYLLPSDADFARSWVRPSRSKSGPPCRSAQGSNEHLKQCWRPVC